MGSIDLINVFKKGSYLRRQL